MEMSAVHVTPLGIWQRKIVIQVWMSDKVSLTVQLPLLQMISVISVHESSQSFL